MADQFTEVTQRGWGQNILSSLAGVLIGIALFIGAFVVLWTNEGRTDLSKVAGNSIAVAPASIDANANGKLVSATGKLTTTETLGDAPYLQNGPYLKLERKVEMFAWEENKEESTKDKLGGGTEVTTTYNYKKDWTTVPENSTEFKVAEGHTNPLLTIEEKTLTANNASIGAYTVDVKGIELPTSEALALTQDKIITQEGVRVLGNFLFIGKGVLETPEVGDVRISYSMVPRDVSVTVFAKADGASLVPYFDKGKTKLYRAVLGNKEEALVALSTEHKTIGWMLRALGFIMMWIGLTLFLGPVNAVLKVLPFLGGLSKGLISIAMFFVALVLSGLTILVSMVAHNLIVLAIVIVLTIVLMRVLFKKKKQTTA